jgi:hypothetical protein
MPRGPLEWHHLPCTYHESQPSGSKVISRRQTDRQTGDMINLLFLESRLKRLCSGMLRRAVWWKLTRRYRGAYCLHRQRPDARPSVVVEVLLRIWEVPVSILSPGDRPS